MAFDIFKTNVAQLAEDGYEFTVKLPDGSPTDWKIKVRGTNSPKVKAHSKAVFLRLQQEEQRAKRAKREVEFDLDKAEDMAIEAAAVRIISWEGLEDNGKPVPATEATVKELMRTQEWVRKQVLDEADNDANFI